MTALGISQLSVKHRFSVFSWHHTIWCTSSIRGSPVRCLFSMWNMNLISFAYRVDVKTWADYESATNTKVWHKRWWYVSLHFTNWRATSGNIECYAGHIRPSGHSDHGFPHILSSQPQQRAETVSATAWITWRIPDAGDPTAVQDATPHSEAHVLYCQHWSINFVWMLLCITTQSSLTDLSHGLGRGN